MTDFDLMASQSQVISRDMNDAAFLIPVVVNRNGSVGLLSVLMNSHSLVSIVGVDIDLLTEVKRELCSRADDLSRNEGVLHRGLS